MNLQALWIQKCKILMERLARMNAIERRQFLWSHTIRMPQAFAIGFFSSKTENCFMRSDVIIHVKRRRILQRILRVMSTFAGGEQNVF